MNIGIIHSIRKLSQKTGIELLKNTDLSYPEFLPNILYLTTSSAGGGLQILVIGLTKFDTASSAERAAFGAGGVILDTMAVDDKRSSLEQIQAIKALKPDIILMAGGIEGGAIAPVLRLAEILQVSNPKAKFNENRPIPLVFAGNTDIHPFITGLFKKKFDLFLIPNIRPTMKEENLAPARDKIHNLFMNNVMEQAPGYAKLKKIVADDIIPTPLGVLKTLQLTGDKDSNNILLTDI